MDRVLITGGRAPAALDLARHCAAAGASVFAADSAPCFLSRSSKAVTKAYRVPSPRHQTPGFIDAIERIVIDEGISLIVPTCEEVFYLAAHAGRLRRHTTLFCPDLPLLRRLHSKWEFASAARDLEISVPQTWLLQSREDIDDLADSGALVFKPVFSRFAVHTLIEPSPKALLGLMPSRARPWIAQRFVAGREFCSYAIARGGTVTAFSASEPLWRAGRASSYYFEPVEAPGLRAIIERLAAALNITGQIAFDAIEDATGELHVLECNPRATSGIHLFDPADGLLAAITGSSPSCLVPHGDRARMLAPAMWMLGLPRALRKGKIVDFVRDYRRASDCLWAPGDPLPSWGLVLGLASFAGTALAKGITPIAASTQDLEWDGEAIP